MNNFYWPVYQNLEKELLFLADQLHFDEDHLGIYSIKISELLIRVAVEIEAISKELYIANNGTPKPLDENKKERFLYFDTDCLALLEKKWNIGEKRVFISAPNFYFQKEENKTFTPLKNANKRGVTHWGKAYQAVKHNRTENIKKGNIKNLIGAFGALYILNIYYKGDQELYWNPPTINFNLNQEFLNFGSKIFYVKIADYRGIGLPNGECPEFSIIDKLVILKYTNQSYQEIKNEYIYLNKTLEENFKKNPIVLDFFKNNPKYNMKGKDIINISFDIGGNELMQEIKNKLWDIHKKVKTNKSVELVLNKNQKIYS